MTTSNSAICGSCSTLFHPGPGLRAYCSRRCRARAANPGRPLAERFWEKVDTSGDCWIWTGGKTGRRYGAIDAGGSAHVLLLAHRVAWEIATGEPIPDGGIIAHSCDNPSCVRNDEESVYVIDGYRYPMRGHLWLASAAANNHDMRVKGRHLRGYKTTPLDRVNIYLSFLVGERKADIARRYAISRSYVGQIVKAKSLLRP